MRVPWTIPIDCACASEPDHEARCDYGGAQELSGFGQMFHYLVSVGLGCLENDELVLLGCNAHIHDGQHHENERLQRDDEVVKPRPYDAGDELADA